MIRTLVIGGAGCVWLDLERSAKLFTPDFAVAVNDIGIYISDITDWVTMHPEKMDFWLEKRRINGFPDPVLWTARHKSRLYKNFDAVESRGGSGLLGARVAKIKKSDKIVLAGIPMDKGSGHFNDHRTWHEADLYKQKWRIADDLKNLTRSMSGWTKELYKYPTIEWLNS